MQQWWSLFIAQQELDKQLKLYLILLLLGVFSFLVFICRKDLSQQNLQVSETDNKLILSLSQWNLRTQRLTPHSHWGQQEDKHYHCEVREKETGGQAWGLDLSWCHTVDPVAEQQHVCYRLTYERTVSSGLQPYILSCFQLRFLHLWLRVPECPGSAGSVLLCYFHQLWFVAPLTDGPTPL